MNKAESKVSIESLIQERGLKHGWVASQLRVTNETLRNWKTKRTKPRELDAERLSQFFDVPVELLDIKD